MSMPSLCAPFCAKPYTCLKAVSLLLLLMVPPAGSQKDGYDNKGYDKYGYDKYGYSTEGYSKYGYDKYGNDKYGESCLRTSATVAGTACLILSD
jgi:hypothetical protein